MNSKQAVLGYNIGKLFSEKENVDILYVISNFLDFKEIYRLSLVNKTCSQVRINEMYSKITELVKTNRNNMNLISLITDELDTIKNMKYEDKMKKDNFVRLIRLSLYFVVKSLKDGKNVMDLKDVVCRKTTDYLEQKSVLAEFKREIRFIMFVFQQNNSMTLLSKK